MSEHKTGLSNWTDEQRKLYNDRREEGLRGQTSTATVHRPTKDEKGDLHHVPLGTKVGSLLSNGKSSSRRAAKREKFQAVIREQRKGSTRGE